MANDRRQAISLDTQQLVGGDGFDFRNDQMRPLLFHESPQGCCIGHVDDMGAVGKLLCRGARVAIHRDHLHAQSLQLNCHFLAEFTCPQKHHPRGSSAQRRSQHHHVYGLQR